MTTVIALEIASLFLLFACSAFFSSAETALFSLNSIQVHRIRRRNPSGGDRIGKLLASPMRLLSTILIGNTLVNVAAAGLGYTVAEALWPDRGMAISIPAMTLLLLVFGEVAPKRLAMSRPERIAQVYARILLVLIRIMTPMRMILEGFSNLLGKEMSARKDGLTEDEFLTVIEMGEEEGVLDEEEREMVDGIVALEEMQASDVMTPRVDLIGIDLDDPIEVSQHKARGVTYRYLPIYRGSPDHAEGFLDVPRFLLAGGTDLEAAQVPPFFVPETTPLDTLLTRFQQENKRIAYVVDEYGGTAGLITRGDILEEIVVDVDNEYGKEKLSLQQVGRDKWLVDGNTSLEDVNYELNLALEAEGVDRISGWVTAQFERIPRNGETIEAQGCRVTIQRARRNRVTLVVLEPTGRSTPPEEVS